MFVGAYRVSVFGGVLDFGDCCYGGPVGGRSWGLGFLGLVVGVKGGGGVGGCGGIEVLGLRLGGF